MPWKINDTGSIEVQSGNPVWVHEDGTEGVIQGNVITKLNSEAKGHRERAEKAEATLKTFEGLDVEAARAAIDKVSKFDQKQLFDSAGVEAVKADLSKQFQAQLAEKDAAYAKLQGTLDSTKLEVAINGSQYVRELTSLPSEAAVAFVQKFVRVENGEVVVIGADGQPIASKKSIGQLASVDEGIATLLEGREDRDKYLRAPTTGGSGAGHGAGRTANGTQTYTRAQFETMNAHQRKDVAKQISEGKVTVVD